ncbi:MAG TPA: hypothetical protein VFU60_13570 [Ktedonobacterales bacterium]|nr:hypothetical protein [Ktedonobacterales bacterium]
MAEVATTQAGQAGALPDREAPVRLSEWTLRPRQLGALLMVRWKLSVRMYRRSVSALIGLAALTFFTLGFAAVAGFLTALGYTNLPVRAASQVLFAALGLLYIAWAALPVLQYSVNEGLDVSKLHAYPVTRAERMVALTLSTFFDPATVIILAIFAAAVVGWHASAPALVITVATLALLYVHVVGLSQCTLAVLVGLLRSRRYRDLSVIVFALMSVLCSLSGQFATVLFKHIDGPRAFGQLDLGHYLQWIPPGMAARAIIAANTGDALGALPWLLALLALTPVLLIVWAWVLDRGVTTPEGGGESARRRRPRAATTSAPLAARPAAAGAAVVASFGGAAAASPRRRRLISPVISAVAIKDLRYFWRDPQIKAALLSSLVLLFVVFAPSLTHNADPNPGYFAQRMAHYQPLLAPLPALLIVLTLSLNAFGLERQGLQTLLLTPARPLEVLWGKNLAVGVVAFTVQVALIVAVCAVTGDWNAMPLALIEGGAATLALLGTGNLTSVFLPLRVRQLRMGSNNLSSENGCLRSVISLVALWATLLALTPVFLLLLIPLFLDHLPLLAFMAPLALVYGFSLYQIATLVIAPRLMRRAPEILAVVARDA